jgi:hypothetical protein
MERRPEKSTFLATLIGAGMLLVPVLAAAQTYSVIHNFSGGSDGANPMAGLTADAAGNLYGTTFDGGSQNCQHGCGTVFKMYRHNGLWLLTTIYAFQGGSDSANPAARVIFGPDGALYGTTTGGQYASCAAGCGSVFRLRPPVTFCASVSCPWTKTTLYAFQGTPDGSSPQGGDLVFDATGNIYGTTYDGGHSAQGTVFKLTHSSNGWSEAVLYSFTGLTDGAHPNGVAFDGAGNLFGTAYAGGNVNIRDGDYGKGVIFELTPSGAGWTQTVIYAFTGAGSDGAYPLAGLTKDGSGSFYGSTGSGGTGACSNGGVHYGCGTIFHGLSTIFALPNGLGGYGPLGPSAALTLDAAGNIYGVTLNDGANDDGNVFKLTAGEYAYTSLHDFYSEDDSGYESVGSVTIDSSGNLFGTTVYGGYPTNGTGVVWEITP